MFIDSIKQPPVSDFFCKANNYEFLKVLSRPVWIPRQIQRYIKSQNITSERIFPKKIVLCPKQLVMTYLVTGYTILWLSSLSNKLPEVQVTGAVIVSWFLSFGNYYEYNGFILKAFKVFMIYWRLNYKLILERIS